MDYMKGYLSRNKRRRASRNRTKRKRRSSGGTGLYMDRSQYSHSGRRKFSWKYPAAAVAGVFVLVLLVLGIGKLFSGNGDSGKVASGSSVTADALPTSSASPAAGSNSSSIPTNPAVTANSPTPVVSTVPKTAVPGTNVPVVHGNTEVPQSTEVSGAAKTRESTENPSAAPDPDGIAADIAAVPTLAPQAIPTPVPKPRSKAVALTFDDGPSTVNTPKVLELLKKYNAHATFFVVGTRVSAGAEVLKQEVAQGCEIGNHTWGHANLSKMSMKKVNKQFNKTANLVHKLIGYDIKLLRPPWGAISQKMRDKLKHPMILWNTDTLDWKSKNPKAILKQVKKQVKDGDIILMHDIHPTTAESLKTVLPWLVKNDYDILTVSELAERKGAPLHNGKAYGGFTGQ